MKSIAASLLALLLTACGGDSSDPQGGSPVPPPQPTAADITLLFMGNSHSSFHNLQGMVAAMVSAANPGESVAAVPAPGWMFLEERLGDVESVSLLRGQQWTFVILQAQKYSTSGQFSYSTEEAKEFVRLSRRSNAVPIMFPEWPRRDITETQRIYDLHVSIAQAEPACVAPIGQAWDLALARHPTLVLHDADGNHSNPAGAFLAALMLATTMTGVSPLDVPPLPQFPVALDTQTQLRAVAHDTAQTWPPRAWCPSDPFG